MKNSKNNKYFNDGGKVIQLNPALFAQDPKMMSGPLDGLEKAKSGIHINPKNKGKFNATKKATGKTTEELTHSKNPVTKKRAIFAENAKHWHHGDDGLKMLPNGIQQIPNGIQAPNTSAWNISSSPFTENLPYNPIQEEDKTLYEIPEENRWNGESLLKGKNPKNIDTKKILQATAFGANVISNQFARVPKTNKLPLQRSYNPFGQGTGSQAIYDDGGYIDDDGTKHGPQKPTPHYTGLPNTSMYEMDMFANPYDPNPEQKHLDSLNYKKNFQSIINNPNSFNYNTAKQQAINLAQQSPNNGQSELERRKAYAEAMQYVLAGQDALSQIKKMDDGGNVEGGGNPPSSTPEQRANWNNFLGYLKKNNIAGSKDLDVRDKSLGLSYLEKYNKEFPKQAIDKEFIPIAQQESEMMKNGIIPQIGQNPNFPIPSVFKTRNTSNVDNWLGSLTSSNTSYPVITKRGDDGDYDFGTDYSAYQAFTKDPSTGAKYLKKSSKQNLTSSNYADGGEMQDLFTRQTPKGDNGMTIYSGGNIKQISNPDHSNPMFKFTGNSHEEGGIKLNYNGKPIEVEGGETAFLDNGGNMNVLGNMRVPGTKMNFDTLGEKLAVKEEKFNKAKNKGATLVNEVDENSKNPYDQFKMNAGEAMMKSYNNSEMQVGEQKENLVALQNAMLMLSNQTGQDPKKLFKADYGITVNGYDPNKKAWDAPQIMPDNPFKPHFPISKFDIGGNINYDPNSQDPIDNSTRIKTLKDIAIKSGKKEDIINFQREFNKAYPKEAQETYSKFPLLPSAKAKKIGIDNPEYNVDGSYGDRTKALFATAEKVLAPKNVLPAELEAHTAVPVNTSEIKSDTSKPLETIYGNQYQSRDFIKRLPYNPKPINDPLQFSEISPELYTLATNHQHDVNSQFERPQLYSPYQVSFQDVRNENQSDYNATAKNLSDSNRYDLLSSLAASKYKANESTSIGQEFRTNQGINAEIYDKNMNILNSADDKNLQMADLQATRQEQARANTEDRTFGAINSISSKYSQNKLENKTANLYSQLIQNYKYNPDEGKFEFDPNSVTTSLISTPSNINAFGIGNGGNKVTQYQYDGNKKIGKVEDDPLDQAQKQVNLKKSLLNMFAPGRR